jgi:hypothetical protein
MQTGIPHANPLEVTGTLSGGIGKPVTIFFYTCH